MLLTACGFLQRRSGLQSNAQSTLIETAAAVSAVFALHPHREERSDFPDEFTHSKYTKAIKGANEKAKANVITAIGELIQIADNKAEFPDYDRRHGNKAKNGWYRYDTRFGIPVYSELGEIERYNIFRARMLVRCDENNKLFLYDVVQIKKETSTPLE